MQQNRATMSSPVPTQTVAPPGGDDIRGIKGPVKIPNPWLPFFWVTGIAIALLIGWRLWRRKQKAMATSALVPGDSPQQRARTALNGSLKSLADPPVFCTRISDALRVFLEEQFGLQAPDRTTEEFLQHLEPASPLSTDQQQSIATFLARCDLVKFARHHPPESELLTLFHTALDLIDQTQRAPQPSNGTGNPAFQSNRT
ncbi:MAG: hypothetical protein K9N62_12845 [Verrucomicrobia bacterium]|nr:hypothetical protein [Verrucomicrobiota bacterium]